MLKKIFIAASLCILSFVLIPSFIFVGWTSADALSEQAGGDNPLNIVIEQSDDKKVQANKPTEPINKIERPDLGDDQVFPFVAGLDSYEK